MIPIRSMGRWIPRWLAAQYAFLLERYGASSFSTADAARDGVRKPEVVLPRLEKSGWVHRQRRGVYTTADPTVAILCSFQKDWRLLVRQKEFVGMLESALASLLSGFGGRLRGAVLFGSVARGDARENSDMDILVVAEGVPASYGERVREAVEMVGRVPTRAETEAKGAHHELELVLLEPSELREPYPFLLDVVNEGVLLYDYEGTTESKLNAIKKEFQSMGAVRSQLPDGSWYWVMETPLP